MEDIKRAVVKAGGYVHPDLRMLVGSDAVYGLVSLSGVTSGELSLRVPNILAETIENPSIWLNFLSSLGYKFDKHFQQTHNMGKGFYPLIGAANHSDKGGKLIYKNDCLELYGVDFCYSRRPKKLALHGII